jgi:hypothetical protein
MDTVPPRTNSPPPRARAQPARSIVPCGTHTVSYRYVSGAGAWLEPLTSTHTDRAIENADEGVVDEQGVTRVGLFRDEGVQHVLDASPSV